MYDNATPGGVGAESRLVFTRTGSALPFVFEHLDAVGNVVAVDNRDTANGWTLTHVSLEDCWLSPVSVPLDFVYVIGEVTAILEGNLPGASADLAARPSADGPYLYVLPLESDLRLRVTGTGSGRYTAAVVSGSLGRSVTLVDVPVGAGATDTIEISNALRDLRLHTTDADKQLRLHYGRGGVNQIRALALEDVGVGRRAALALRTSSDLGSFELEAGGPQRQVAVRLTSADGEKVHRERYEQFTIGKQQATALQVEDWMRLGPDSLRPR